MGRRISSTVNNQTTLYAYDGWNVVEEYQLQPSSFILQTLHTWGLDLSGTIQGAGGVGGLLYTEDLSSSTAWHHHYDGNGNVTHLTDASATCIASYTYDAFGNTETTTGPAASANKYRFSTKPIDDAIPTNPLYYYGYRFYNPITGRWINRDPIEEKGGLNLYGFVGNDGVGKWDFIGLRIINGFMDAINAYAEQTNINDVFDAGKDLIESVSNAVTDETKAPITSKPFWELTGKTKMTCANSGEKTTKGHFLVDTGNLVLGRVDLYYVAKREWRCEKCEREWSMLWLTCACDCNVTDTYNFSFKDIYDFTPHPNDEFYKRWHDHVTGAIADILDGKAKGTSYTIQGEFTKKHSFSRLVDCKK